MNHLQEIQYRARSGYLPSTMDAAYYAGADYAERLKFAGKQGMRDHVAAHLFMLAHVPLDPREADAIRAQLAAGVVLPTYFGWSNPVPLLLLEPGEALDQITAAVEANLAGPKVAAARRVLKWRQRWCDRDGQRDAATDRFRKSLPWPPLSRVWPEPSNSPAIAEREHLYAMIRVRDGEISQRRVDQLARLDAAAQPDKAGWHDFLHSLVAAVFQPLRVLH